MRISIVQFMKAMGMAAIVIFAVHFHCSAEDAAPKFRAFVLTEKGGQHGAFVDAALQWLSEQADAEHFAYYVYENVDQVNEKLLARYQVFIQLNYPPYTWKDKAAAVFQNYIEEGKVGWVGFHHATLLGEFDGYPMWKWFSEFMGGIRFENYIAKLVSGTVTVEAKDHPCMKDVPASFTIDKEEWYTYDKNPRPNVHVLARVEETSYNPSSDIKMGDHPVVWTNEKMKARNIYIFMGHHPDLFKNEAYKTLFHNSILWAAGQ